MKSVIEETIQKSQQQRKISESNSIEMDVETSDKKSGSMISVSSDQDPNQGSLKVVIKIQIKILSNPMSNQNWGDGASSCYFFKEQSKQIIATH